MASWSDPFRDPCAEIPVWGVAAVFWWVLMDVILEMKRMAGMSFLIQLTLKTWPHQTANSLAYRRTSFSEKFQSLLALKCCTAEVFSVLAVNFLEKLSRGPAHRCGKVVEINAKYNAAWYCVAARLHHFETKFLIWTSSEPTYKKFILHCCGTAMVLQKFNFTFNVYGA